MPDTNDTRNYAADVARAEHGSVPLERCSCGCLKPVGNPCPNARADLRDAR